MGSRRWYDDDGVQSVIDKGELLSVAVAARYGPHVSPVAYHLDRQRLWFAIPRGSVKAYAVARRPRVGGLIRAGDRAVLISGRAEVIDLLTVRGVTSIDRLLELPFAVSGYLGRNTRHAGGIVRGRPLPTLPISRVGVVLDISCVALLDGGLPVAQWGQWQSADLLFSGEVPDFELPDAATALPGGLNSLLEVGTDVVLGWESLSGPMAFPARWQGATIKTCHAALALAGAGPSSPACIMSDRSGPRLADKQGVLLRGEGHARLCREAVVGALSCERITWWSGDQSGTATVRG